MFKSKFKFLLALLLVAIVAGVVVACSDDDDPDYKAEGKKAGVEMCDCVASYVAPNYEDYESYEEFTAAFTAYAANLSGCLGIIAQYQEYVTVDINAYDPEADEPLFSVFSFKNDEFKEGFMEGAGGCADTFTALFEMMF